MHIMCAYLINSHNIILQYIMHRMNYHDDLMLEVPRPDLHGSVHYV